MDTDIFVVLSMINPGEHPLSYTKVRSVFSAEQRFNQTLESIASIRKFMPKATILLVECSILSQEQIALLQKSVDYFVYLVNDESIAHCILTEKKGQGEAYQTLCAVKYIQENKIPFRRLFKLSGRYSLNDEFKEQNFSLDVFTFKQRVQQSTPSHSTVLYSVPCELFDYYSQCVNHCVEFYRTQNRGWEEVLPPLLNPKQELHRMGAQGLVAVNGDFFTC